ncbi:peroxiredoxin [Maricurvus nonylphenolicus]|uniref:peroxiredoxin n=1 Tax=Maricurvus nonylphenolicus TaxID=1008307 RepID=UPI0036F1EDFF
MSIQAGDKIPSLTLSVMGDKGPQPVTTDELFGGKKVVMFAVPGAFTPGCSMTHLPGFVVNADKIKDKGVDTIICTSVNDAFVMGAWGKDQNAEHLVMLADGNGELAEALGLSKDASAFQMGTRSQRYALIANDGVVELLNVDEKGIDKSSAETILAAL